MAGAAVTSGSKWLARLWLVLAVLLLLYFLADWPRNVLWVLLVLVGVAFLLSIPAIIRWWRSLSRMDKPAVATVLLLAVLLIGASAPFLDVAPAASGNDFLIGWTETETGSASAPVGASGAPTTLRVEVNDVLPSNATVAVDCTDGGQPPLTGTATITWILYEGDEEKDRGSFTCNGTNEEKVPQEDRPDIGSASAGSASDAREEAYAGLDNETVEYRAVFTWTRSGGTPLPVPVEFSGTYSLTLEHWTATAVETDQEVPR